MMRLSCVREAETARAVRSAARSAELEAHLTTCAACREAARVATWLQPAALKAVAEATPPDAGRVWNRVAIMREVVRRQELTRRATRPARWFQRAGGLAAAAATVAWIVIAGPALWPEVEAFLSGEWSGASVPVPAGFQQPWMLVLLTGTLVVLAIALGRAALDRLARP